MAGGSIPFNCKAIPTSSHGLSTMGIELVRDLCTQGDKRLNGIWPRLDLVGRASRRGDVGLRGEGRVSPRL